MSTRSNIAIELPDGKVKAIYVHSDGYPNGVGHCLLTYWKYEVNAKKLFAFGNASSLGSDLKDCSFYERDWGRDEEKARTYNNEWCFLNDMSGDIFIEYIYLFKKGHWYVSEQKSSKHQKITTTRIDTPLSHTLLKWSGLKNTHTICQKKTLAR